MFTDSPSTLQMSSAERQRVSVLVVEPEPNTRSKLRQILLSLEFGNLADVPDHIQALKRLEERSFSHIIFDAKQAQTKQANSMPPKEFLNAAMELNEGIIAVASSFEPTVDDVFTLLCHGARGFLVKPFTMETVEQAMIAATKGEPISDAILYAKDRNEALVSLVMTAFDKYALVTRQAMQFETAKRDIPRAIFGVKRAVEVANLFAKGGQEKFIEALVEFCIERGNGPASKLGRVRRRLSESKKQKDELSVKAANLTGNLS